MNEASKNELVDEINEILKSRFPFIEENYRQIRDVYKNTYDWPDLDPLRHEICLCIFFRLGQAAITLTNHFFESLFKVALIYLDSLDSLSNQQPVKTDIPTVASLTQVIDPAFQKYNPNNLGDSINRACTIGLITKEQKKNFQNLRENFRNAFSHSDKQKTFGNSATEAQAVRIGDSGLEAGVVEEVESFKLIFAHGIIQAELANAAAIPYFLYMDTVARQIREKLFDNQNKNGGGITSRSS